MNNKVMKMLYSSDGGNISRMRGRDSRGRYMDAYGGGYDRVHDPLIGYGEQDAYDRGMRMMDTYDDGRGGTSFDYSKGQMPRQQMTMGMGGTHARQQMETGIGDIEEYIEKPITIGEAMKWAEELPEGAKWKTEDVKQYAQKVGIPTSGKAFAEFYAVMNALHSDYHKVLAKHGITDPQVYADLACAWINDEDAVENKSAVYYRFIVDGE